MELGGCTTGRGALSVGAARFAPVLLEDASAGGRSIIGVALLASSETDPRPELVRAIGRCLFAAGDSTALTGEVC